VALEPIHPLFNVHRERFSRGQLDQGTQLISRSMQFRCYTRWTHAFSPSHVVMGRCPPDHNGKFILILQLKHGNPVRQHTGRDPVQSERLLNQAVAS
jgi:hypothetical protein